MKAAQLPPHSAEWFSSMLCVCGVDRRGHMMGGSVEEHAFEPRDVMRRSPYVDPVDAYLEARRLNHALNISRGDLAKMHAAIEERKNNASLQRRERPYVEVPAVLSGIESPTIDEQADENVAMMTAESHRRHCARFHRDDCEVCERIIKERWPPIERVPVRGRRI